MTFNALGLEMKNEGKTLAEFLGIEMPVFEADELTAEVNDTENLKEIVVELSNAKLADEDKVVDTNSYKLTGNVIENAELDGNNVILLLENALVKGREYELVIRGIDTDVNGKYEFEAKDNTIPTVEKVEVLGEYGIKVTTSEPIDTPRERDFLIDGKNVAMDLEQYGRDLILTPYYNKSFDEDAETLTIKELNDFAGYRTVEDDFEIEIVKDEVAPKVVDVIARGNKVEVIFDKDIYEDSLGAYYNRSDLGNISYELGRHDVYAIDFGKVDTNKVVYEFEDELPRRTDVTIVGVQNHSKVKMEETEIEARELIDYTEPEIIDTKVTKLSDSSVEIKLYFDKDVKGSFAKNADGTYSETEFDPAAHFTLYEYEVLNRNISTAGEVTKAEYYGTNKDVVVVTVEGLTLYNAKDNDLEYILEIEDFTDATSQRNRMYRDYVEFKVNPTASAFKVNKVTLVPGRYDTTEIVIEFNKAVDRVLAENLANYIFRDTDGVRYDVDDLDGEIKVEDDGKEVSLIIPDFDEDDFDTLTILETLKDKDGRRLNKETVYNFATGKTDDEEAADAAVSAVVDASDADELLVALKNDLFKDVVDENKAAYFASAEFVALDEDSTVEDVNKAIKAVNEAVEAAKEQADKDKSAATNVMGMIAGLNLDNPVKTDVEAARAAYNALTDNQKALVTNYDSLEAAEAKIEKLEDKAAVDAAKEKVKSEYEIAKETEDTPAAKIAAVTPLVENDVDNAEVEVEVTESEGTFTVTLTKGEATATKVITIKIAE